MIQGNNTEKLLAVLTTPFQSLESALQQLLVERSLDTAVGAQLDVIGKIIGQARNGQTDDDYRRYCRARVGVNKATGITENLITVTDLIVYDDTATYRVENQGTATVKVTIQDLAITTELANILLLFLKQTVSAGVRLVIQYGISAPSGWFRFDSGPGWDLGHLVGALDNS